MEFANMGNGMNRQKWLLGTCLAFSIATAVAAQYNAPQKTARDYSPNLTADYPDRVNFGDAHLHNSNSVNGGMVGDGLGPDEAYQFARGETVTASLGHKAKLRRPLDFLVVADHAESIGLAPLVANKDPLAMNDPVGKVLPLSGIETSDPEKLWDYLENYEKATGGQVLAIPHNGNLSNGKMFDGVTFSGAPLDADYARRRQRWEPLYEGTQIKGNGEMHLLLSTFDKFANYYRWERRNFGTASKTPTLLPREYARSALQRGLAYEAKLDVNPFKFGMIGSSDSHTSLAGTAEDNFYGKAAPFEPGSGNPHFNETIIQPLEKMEGTRQFGYESLASGLIGVWARANTREEIFDAMKQHEVFATTGSRMRLRMFASWNFTAADKDAPDLRRIAYAKGVPMGDDLTGNGTAPGLLVEAIRDLDGANLNRIQIVKGSVEGATYRNRIGAPLLSTLWRDPTYRAGERAFHYARVLEIPTPTWLAYDVAQIGPRTLPKHAQVVYQERAYGQPIWVGSR
jgi:Protein of unknown function (DUF3604)